MAGYRDTKRNRRSRSAKARRRVVGLTSGVGAFLALGMTQLATAPTVKADEFDAILEPIINAITGSLGDVAAGWAAVPELGSLGLGAADPAAGVGLGSLPDVSSVAAANPVDAWLQGLEQAWINSSFGQQVDTALNDWFNQVDPSADPTAGACGLVCNGADAQGAQPMSQNLLVNPGFETADPSGSGYSGVTIPGWTETGTPTVIAYGTQGGYPLGLSSPFPRDPRLSTGRAPGRRRQFRRRRTRGHVHHQPNRRPHRRSRNAVHAECRSRRPGLEPVRRLSAGHLPRRPLGTFWAPARSIRSRYGIAWVSPGLRNATSPGRSRRAPPPRR